LEGQLLMVLFFILNVSNHGLHLRFACAIVVWEYGPFGGVQGRAPAADPSLIVSTKPLLPLVN
jgi:hypothetical protein